MLSNDVFSAFWNGSRLSNYDILCLRSFAKAGLAVRLYSFSSVENCPEGVELCDASEIAKQETLTHFLIDGRPNMSHYSDYFRYLLFRKIGCTWIDTDVFLLDAMRLPKSATIIANEDRDSICGAIMKIDSQAPQLDRMIANIESLAGKPLIWGETGPKLLTRYMAGDPAFNNRFGPETFYPIHYYDFWKIFLPKYRAECEACCHEAATLHLWNNLIDKLGVSKEIGPPVGSFLYGIFSELGGQDLFISFYTESNMETLVQNFLYRIDTPAAYGTKVIGLRTLARLFMPALQMTARNLVGLIRNIRH